MGMERKACKKKELVRNIYILYIFYILENIVFIIQPAI